MQTTHTMPRSQAATNELAPSRPRPGVFDVLYCLAGAAPEDLRALPQRTRIQYGTVGFVFLLNLLVLLFVWSKVGLRYFGPLGVLVPGVAVPCLFVLGLDRLVAMRHRTLTGELAGFNLPGQDGRNWEPLLRVAMALTLSALTTFTFMLDRAADPIRLHQNEVAKLANQPLRQELDDRIQSTFGVTQRQLQARQEQLASDRAALQAQFESTQSQMVEIEALARLARTEAVKEVAGLDNRLAGAGVRFRGQSILMAQHEQAAAVFATRQRGLLVQRQALDKEASELRLAANAAAAERNRGQANLQEDVQLDARHVTPARGLFADATAFLALYNDPHHGDGLRLFTWLLAGFMFAIECVALLCLAINPSSPLDVLRITGNREAAAGIVARSELAIAGLQARGAPLYVRAHPVVAPTQQRPNGVEA